MLLAVLTVAAIFFAWFNLQKEQTFAVPSDGVWWMEREGSLRAERVDPNGPGENAGVKEGDLLLTVNEQPVTTVAGVTRRLERTGIWSKAAYGLSRQGVPLEVSVILAPADKSLNTGLRVIALIYLGIGLFVLLRRWTAPKSTHFYVFCLVSFVLYSFKYVGNWSLFDRGIYWSNVVAGLLQPALFLHFVLTFPETREFVRKRRWLLPAVYVPGLLLLLLQVWALTREASELLRWNLDRLQMSYQSVFFVLATGVLWKSYRAATGPLLRQQMKWVTWGTLLAIAPFTALYVIPYLAGAMPNPLMKVSVLSLIFLPLTFGYAIVRYRLMDVDLIFKRGMTYTLTTLAIVGMYFGTVALVAFLVQTRIPSSGPIGLIAAVVVTALLFEPFKRWIQDHIDKFFYKKRYDYRRTLLEFGRELNSETDLNRMLSAVVDRLSRTLLVDRLAVFVASGGTERFAMAKSSGISYAGEMALSFLSAARPELGAGHLFFDNPRQAVRETPSAQEAIAQLDLNYYIPCTVQNRTIAVLGLGKTVEGHFLSSEDVELLETLAGTLGIAIQNARLYASLEQKAQEYERLKEFNENIVESISVGVLAVDLDDCIESWNAQMEVMFATARGKALGQPLSEIFPASFMEEFYRHRQSPGIRNLYKFRMTTAAGETRMANIAIAPLVSREFQVIGRIILLDDITERMGLESQLTQAEKMSSIGLLAAGVAHEVNTPLAVISSYAQMLSKRVQSDPKQAELLEKITAQTFRASEIVNNLLNFSRTSGTEFSDVDVNKVITETLALLEHQFKTAHIKVRDQLTPGLTPIQGNPGKLQQVFLNLFLNAKDAMAGGGTLTVTTQNGSGVSVAITDTGSGIAQEHIDRIYDPFFTTKASANEGQRRGTGLGLSVTYGIIQEHAGKIRVESRPGQGTTFHLEFPLMRQAVNA
ncbi:MAG TPA: ATP-binding protein [Terriglobales bacterium]|nr:ATP-binding protein [Terriglobales bacterium]